MITAVKSWFFNRRLRQSLETAGTLSKAAVNRGLRVAILTDDGCDRQAVDRFASELNKKGRTVHTLHYTTTKAQEPELGTVTPKQLNWYGWPQSDTVDQWLSTPYDILLVLATQPTDIITMLVTCTRAELKTGATAFIDVVDLVVDLNETESTSDLIRKITTTIGHLSAA